METLTQEQSEVTTRILSKQYHCLSEKTLWQKRWIIEDLREQLRAEWKNGIKDYHQFELISEFQDDEGISVIEVAVIFAFHDPQKCAVGDLYSPMHAIEPQHHRWLVERFEGGFGYKAFRAPKRTLMEFERKTYTNGTYTQFRTDVDLWLRVS